MAIVPVPSFNWGRAIEGAVVTASVAGVSAYEVASVNPALTAKAVIASVLVTFFCAFVKGVGQNYSTPQ